MGNLFEINYDDIKDVQPAFDHNFDIKIESPWLKTWFPATSVDYDPANINSKTFKAGNMNFSIPIDTNTKKVAITFFDSETRILERWITNWINNEILNDGNGIAILHDCSKLMSISALNINHLPVKTNNYWVYPDGTFPVRYTSQGQILLFTQTFNIVGEALSI